MSDESIEKVAPRRPKARTEGVSAPSDGVRLRLEALRLAVDTVAGARGFTTTQVLYTADLYNQYLTNGALPPLKQVQAPAQEEGTDAEV
ncbi:hypothetical protein FDI61_gp016 [Mycobacterium phage Marvin]|uniref:Uncharacterized protein n=1 Tax=Mycobacterium phage Marvin TaxID=1034139 RepID=G1BN86_9CAUD|nr:hypothetical protein FDI61_gp016 [Mycobacterium phage Marvin]AEJ95300.1 hypothetical protein MARVIN_16 [Mycobacterium phage Marvin]